MSVIQFVSHLNALADALFSTDLNSSYTFVLTLW